MSRFLGMDGRGPVANALIVADVRYAVIEAFRAEAVVTASCLPTGTSSHCVIVLPHHALPHSAFVRAKMLKVGRRPESRWPPFKSKREVQR
jgi:hypothetical protein